MANATYPVEDLTDADVDAVKKGHPVRICAPSLGGDLVILLANPSEATDFVLRDRLKDLASSAAWQASVEKARSSAMTDDAW